MNRFKGPTSADAPRTGHTDFHPAHPGALLVVAFATALLTGPSPNPAAAADASDLDFAWSHRVGGEGVETGSAIAVDPDGATVTVGNYSGFATFGEQVPPWLVGDNRGGNDVFILKLKEDGSFHRARTLGGPGDDSAVAVVTDASSRIYIAGYLAGDGEYDTNRFQAAEPGTHVFLARLNADLRFDWFKSFGRTNTLVRSLSIDPEGNMVVVGSAEGITSFDHLSITNPSGHAPFLLTVDPLGTPLRVRTFGTTGPASGVGTAHDPQGRDYLAGNFSGQITVDGITLEASGTQGIFVARLSPGATHSWALAFGNTNFISLTRLTIAPSGNVLLTGSFRGTLDLPGVTLVSAGDTDPFLISLDSEGHFQWARRAGGPGFDLAHGLTVTPDHRVFWSTSFRDKAEYGPIRWISSGETDMNLSALSAADGTWLWSASTGGGSHDYCTSLAVDRHGNIHATGWFVRCVTFGTVGLCSTFGRFFATTTDAFVAKVISPPTIHPSSSPEGHLMLEITDDSVRPVTIETSPNLGSWSVLPPAPPRTSVRTLQLTITNPPSPAFYRAVRTRP